MLTLQPGGKKPTSNGLLTKALVAAMAAGWRVLARGKAGHTIVRAGAPPGKSQCLCLISCDLPCPVVSKSEEKKLSDISDQQRQNKSKVPKLG